MAAWRYTAGGGLVEGFPFTHNVGHWGNFRADGLSIIPSADGGAAVLGKGYSEEIESSPVLWKLVPPDACPE